jgi:DNA-binding HxlR family transcriptional regulator
MIERIRAALRLLEPKWSVDVIFLLASGMRRHARLVDNVPGLLEESPDLDSAEARGERNSSPAGSTPRSPSGWSTHSPPLGWQLTEPLMALYEWAVAHEGELRPHGIVLVH